MDKLPPVTTADVVAHNLQQKRLAQEPGTIEQAIFTAAGEFAKYLDGKVGKTEIVNQLKEIGTPDALKVIPAINDLHNTLKTHKNTDLTEVTSVMKQLLEEAKKIPKQNIDIPQTVIPDYAKQFTGLTNAIKGVETVVKAQKLIAKAPVVNVKHPDVHVDAPNLVPLQSGIKDVVEAVKSIIIPEHKTDTVEVQKLLKTSNKLLEEILDKPVGSGGGGQSWTAVNSAGIPVPLNLDSSGNLKVSGTGGGGGADVQYTDGDATITHPIGTIPVFNKAGTITAVSDTNPLPTSASISLTNYANETGGNLAAIKADTDKIPSQGQALAAASTPVVLPAAQITTLTPPAAITNYANETGGNLATIAGKDFATQTTLALIKAKTDNIDVALSTRTKPADQQHVIVDSGVTTGLTDTQLRATAVPVSLATAPTTPVTGTFFQVTQPVSVASLPLPTGAATSASQTTGNSSLSSIDSKLSGTLSVTGSSVGSSSGAVNVGQQTVNTTAVQISASSTVPTNGMLIGALSTNTASIFIGGSGVTTSNGAELLPGASLPFTCNLNTLYIRSVASTTDKIWWNVA